MFAHYDTKSRTYGTTMNLKTGILLSIDFHSFYKEYVFIKMRSILGMNISEYLSV